MSNMFSIAGENSVNHPKEILNHLLSSGDFADVTIMCEDLRPLRTHKFILNSCSPVFRNILDSNSHNTNPIIYLRGIHGREMESVLEYMYLGEVKMSQEKMDDFLKVALDLKVKDISKSREQQKNDDNVKKTAEEENNIEKNVEASESLDTSHVQNRVLNPVKFENYDIHACNFCKRKFTLEKSLKRHIESTHEKSMYCCNHCPLSFTDANKLNSHLQSEHEGMKYVCADCQETFCSQVGLKIHMKRAHMVSS